MSNLYLYVLPIILYTYYIASNTMSAFYEDPYIHIMEPGDVLYHGNLDEEYNIHQSERIKWFSKDIRNVLQYGYPKKYSFLKLVFCSYRNFNNFKFKNDDTMLFGRESAGVPNSIHSLIKNRLKIPMLNNKRSLNISSSVAIILSENLRQTGLI